MSDKIIAYTDGACLGNPGPGGWAIIICHGQEKQAFSGYQAHTTNNRMELEAAIKALEKTDPFRPLTLFSDSQYLVRGIKEWLPRWKQNNWRRSRAATIINIDLWRRLDQLSAPRAIAWQWVKGHADNSFNNHCDKLAKAAITKNYEAAR